MLLPSLILSIWFGTAAARRMNWALHFNRKIAKSLMKLSNSGLQRPLKSSKFCIFSEVLTSAKYFAKFQCFHKKITKSMFFPKKTLIKAKYKCQEKEKVELENSM